ncbi:MAG: 2-oxoacid:acceptor oxidoreductase subunit alpha [Verrucomicrobiae bacterium]|nr:2-oxoacid:acceptor oxidoreductase subunit alpha [Verrucomicrobiae bacterium]MDW8343895.1 2-oxoacid:acceptor oxidoreductase subunit alpha [Verrucomicrobiae bacterium]
MSESVSRPLTDAVIRFAGNSQDGIQAIGGFLARLAGRTDKDVMTYMTIPATISGGPSIFQVRLGTGEVLSAGDEVDILVAFYQHSYQNHIATLRTGGLLIYDSDAVQPEPNPTRYRTLGVPISSLTVEAIGGTGKDKGKNMFVLGLVARLFDLDLPKLERMLEDYYRSKGEDVVRRVLGAFHAGYAYNLGQLTEDYRFAGAIPRGDRPRVVMDGNQALAYGAIAAGIRFGAGYPITPWSTIMETLRAELPKYGGIFVQAEDELAAIAMACGASYAGYLAVTGTSGPGISLKSEAIGWAVMAEIPVVIVDVQRGGPSTGLPTNVEQSDLNLACYASHGDAPRIVIAPADVEDCFYTMIEAANLAREYSCPVIVLTDQALATRVETFEMPDFSKCVQDLSPTFEPRGPNFKPYANTPDGIAHHAPPGTPMVDGKYPVVTGLEHDESGHPASRPANHVMMVAKRRRKLQVLAGRLPKPEVYGPPEGNVLLVGWGSTRGPIREAVDRARAEGESVSAVHIRYLNPLPPGLDEIFDGFPHIFVVELNDEGLYGYGQLAAMLRARYCNDKIRGINKTDGLPFKVREILDQMRRKLSGLPVDVSAAIVEVGDEGGGG